jgi:hypothetical protein
MNEWNRGPTDGCLCAPWPEDACGTFLGVGNFVGPYSIDSRPALEHARLLRVPEDLRRSQHELPRDCCISRLQQGRATDGQIRLTSHKPPWTLDTPGGSDPTVLHDSPMPIYRPLSWDYWCTVRLWIPPMLYR